MNYKLLGTIYSILIILSIMAPLSILSNAPIVNAQQQRLTGYFKIYNHTGQAPPVVEVNLTDPQKSIVYVNLSNVNIPTGANLYIWISNDTYYRDPVIKPDVDAPYLGPIPAAAVVATVSDYIPYTVDVYKPFNNPKPDPLSGSANVLVGNYTIKFRIPLQLVGNNNYTIKITTVSPETIKEHPDRTWDALPANNNFKIIFGKIEIKTENDLSYVVPYEPIDVKGYALPKDHTINITMDGELVKGSKKNVSITTVTTFLGKKWEVSYYECLDIPAKDLELKNGNTGTFEIKVYDNTSNTLLRQKTFTEKGRIVKFDDISGIITDGSSISRTTKEFVSPSYVWLNVSYFPYKASITVTIANKTYHYEKIVQPSPIELNCTGNATVKIYIPIDIPKTGWYNITIKDDISGVIYSFKIYVKIGPIILIEPSEAKVGANITVIGKRFNDYEGKNLTIWFQVDERNDFYREEAWKIINATKEWSITITVPNATYGLKNISVSVGGLNLTGYVPENNLPTVIASNKTLKILPDLKVQPRSIPANSKTEVTILGTGLRPDDHYNVLIDTQLFLSNITCGDTNETAGVIIITSPITGLAPGLHSSSIYNATQSKYSYKPLAIDYFNVTGTTLDDIEKKLDEINETIANMDLEQLKEDILKAISDLKENVTLEIRDVKNGLTELIITKSGEVVKNITFTSDFSLMVLYMLLSEMNTTIVDVKGDVATLVSEAGTIKTNVSTVLKLLSEMNATIAEVKDGMVTIKSDVGTIKTDVSTLLRLLSEMNTTIVDVKGDVATLVSEAGTIKADIEALTDLVSSIGDNIAMKLDEVNKSLANLIVMKGDEIVSTLSARLDALNATIIDIKGDTVTIKTILGNVTAKLDEIEKLLKDMNDTLLVINKNVAYLVNEAGSIATSIDDLKIMITQLGDVIELKIGELSTNLTKIVIKKGDEIVTTLSARLDALNATIIDIDGKVVTLSTVLGNVKTTIDDLKSAQAEIKDLIKTKSKDIVAVIDTAKGDITAKLDIVNDLIKNGVKVDTENILAKIGDLKNSVGTVSDKLDALAASLDNVKTSLDNIKSKLDDVKNSIDGVKTSINNAKSALSSDISSAVDNLKTTIEDNANSVSGNVSTYGLVNLILILIAIILTAYVGFFHKKE